MAYGSVLGRNTKPQFVPTFAISGPLPGDTVTVSYGGTTVEAVEDNGVWYAKAWAYGSYTVTLTATAGTKSTTVNVDEVKLYEITLTNVSNTLNDNNWDLIKTISNMGQASNYWNVGDTKSIVLNGTVQGYTFSNLTVNAFIIGIDHNAELEGNNLIHFQLGKIGSTAVAFCDNNYGVSGSSSGFRMNLSKTNVGGWSESYGRNTLLGNSSTPVSPLSNSFVVGLPSDLRAVVKSVTKYTNNKGRNSVLSAITATIDYLFFLAEFEIQGTITAANQYEQNYQSQYDYYKAGNSKIKYRHDATGTAVYYWCRSAFPTYEESFCVVNNVPAITWSGAFNSLGIAPAFCV